MATLARQVFLGGYVSVEDHIRPRNGNLLIRAMCGENRIVTWWEIRHF
jgi:hypothetical protein